jgi:hypothetical protein
MASSLDGAFAFDATAHSLRCTVANPDGAEWMDVLARRVLPRIAILCGATVLHAACAARDGQALMFVGDSGAGKSTLSAALGHAGWDVLSDDITIIWTGERVTAAPATTGMCVWPDSRRGLGLPDDACEPLPAYGDKMRFVPGGEHGVEPVPLKGVVMLAREQGASPRLDPIEPRLALIELARHRIRVNPSDPGGAEARAAFAALGRVVSEAAAWRLVYPVDYAALPMVADLLHGLLRD